MPTSTDNVSVLKCLKTLLDDDYVKFHSLLEPEKHCRGPGNYRSYLKSLLVGYCFETFVLGNKYETKLGRSYAGPTACTTSGSCTASYAKTLENS